MMEEFDVLETNETPAMDVPVNMVDGDAKGSRELFTLADGSQGSRAEFIREKFLVDNMSRKAITETYGIPYRAVYSATVNLENSAEASPRGRSVQNAVILVTEDNQAVVEKDGVIYVNGVEVDEMPETLETTRNEWIQEQVAAGVSRADIAKFLGLSYGVIYNATKDLEGSRTRHEVTLEDGTVISRNDYIRTLHAEGMSRGDIAKQLDVPYSVVWQATKVEKSIEDKFQEAVQAVMAFRANVVNVDAFDMAIAELQEMEVKEVATVTEEAAE